MPVQEAPPMSARRSIAIASAAAVIAAVVAACTASSSSPSIAAGPSAQATSVSVSAGTTASVPPSPIASPVPSVAASPDVSAYTDPANFTSVVGNPWLPFVPGTVFTYSGTKDGEPAVDVVTVTSKTAVIGGVTCVVIEDRLKLNGVLEEWTTDYYTQDLAGNVWYFGEDTEELDAKGKVTSREGSWHAGVDGAVPGIFMEATPAVGHEYVQEFYKGHAEDHFRVKALDASVTVPFGSFSNVLLTEEWTPLEPAVLDNKYYVEGVGEVREVAVKGPVEELMLVSVTGP
jgi:hypothetical protein